MTISNVINLQYNPNLGPPPKPITSFDMMEGTTMHVENLSISVDMLKRLITQDSHVVHNLGISLTSKYDAIIGNSKPFQLGWLEKISEGDDVNYIFQAYDFTESLQNLQICSGDTIYVALSEELI